MKAAISYHFRHASRYAYVCSCNRACARKLVFSHGSAFISKDTKEDVNLRKYSHPVQRVARKRCRYATHPYCTDIAEHVIAHRLLSIYFDELREGENKTIITETDNQCLKIEVAYTYFARTMI